MLYGDDLQLTGIVEFIVFVNEDFEMQQSCQLNMNFLLLK